MDTHDLYCTAQIHIGSHAHFEQEGLQNVKKQMLLLKKMHWNNHRCTVDVSVSRIHKRPEKTPIHY